MVKLLLAAAVVLTVVQAVAAFDVNQCTGFAFYGRSQPGATEDKSRVYYCGAIPEDGKFCDASSSLYLVDWLSNEACDFLVDAVKTGYNSLAPELRLDQIPVPNGGPLKQWACYMPGAGYVVDYHGATSTSTLPLAASINTQCTRTGCFDAEEVAYFKGEYNPSYTLQEKGMWDQCFFNDVHYPGQKFKECLLDMYCEYVDQHYARCMPYPDHEHDCCLSPWQGDCKAGQCCTGYYCDEVSEVCKSRTTEKPGPVQTYTGICSSTSAAAPKTERFLENRCFEPTLSFLSNTTAAPAQGDCALGLVCEGDEWYAKCLLDPKYEDPSNPDFPCYLGQWEGPCRPGDCAPGWRCKLFFDEGGSPSWSHCRPGTETLTRPNVAGGPAIPVHDGLCSNPDYASSYSEKLGSCTGAICNVWGDPHIVSCDNKRWDCQAAGLFVLMRNFMFEVQGHFSQMTTIWDTSASYTDAVAIKFKTDTAAPKIQFMFPDFVTRGETYDTRSRKMGNCPVLFYVNGAIVSISDTSKSVLHDANNVKVRVEGWNKIIVEYKASASSTVTMEISSDGGGPFTEWGCMFSTTICLPQEFQDEFKNTGTGLLGKPDGNIKNDWMTRNGTVVPYGWGQAEYDYCTKNWCVTQEENIMRGKDFNLLKCSDQPYKECGMPQLLARNITEQMVQTKCCGTVAGCVPSMECVTDLCITGLVDPDPIVPLGDPPSDPPPSIIDDCSNLGKYVSQATGQKVLPAASYMAVKSCVLQEDAPWTTGLDSSLSVMVGKSYKCIQGTGVEGSMFVDKNFIVDSVGEHGCSSFVSTSRGACVIPPQNSQCIQVGANVSIGSSSAQRVSIVGGSIANSCNLVYAGSCSIHDNSTCPSSRIDLASEFLITGGQALKVPTLDLSDFRTTLSILRQKQQFWKDYAPLVGGVKDTGTWELSTNTLILKKSTGNSCVQVFNFPNGWPAGVTIVKFLDLNGKTVLINVGGTSTTMAVPYMVDHNDRSGIAEGSHFDIRLVQSIVWNFHAGGLTITGDNPFQGSIVVNGDFNMQAFAQLGRTLVLGNLIQNKIGSTIYNYPFQPQCPLPLATSDVCTVSAPPPCIESWYKVLTSKEVCPGSEVVRLRSSRGTLPPNATVIYGIQLGVPQDGGAPFVSFKVDNPFPGLADMYVKYEKPVGKFALDPACTRTSMVKDCEPTAVAIRAGCVAHDGVDPYSAVTVYFASDTDAVSNQGLKTKVDKCCDAEEYDKLLGFGVVSFTFEIKCACPSASGLTSQ